MAHMTDRRGGGGGIRGVGSVLIACVLVLSVPSWAVPDQGQDHDNRLAEPSSDWPWFLNKREVGYNMWRKGKRAELEGWSNILVPYTPRNEVLSALSLEALARLHNAMHGQDWKSRDDFLKRSYDHWRKGSRKRSYMEWRKGKRSSSGPLVEPIDLPLDEAFDAAVKRRDISGFKQWRKMG